MGKFVFYRQKSVIKRIIVVFAVVLAISLCFYLVRFVVDSKFYGRANSFSLNSSWKNYDYKRVYDLSSEVLYKKKFDYFALTLHGFSAFYLALAETDLMLAQDYLDEAVFNIRNALIYAKKKNIPQLEYMLGKIYFYRNLYSSSYYYADLAVSYLLKSIEDGYKSNDVPEFLGLMYADLGMHHESISYFTEALILRESDNLLLSIAEQYRKINQNQATEQYLYRISQNCKDEQIEIKTHLLLGEIYIDQEKYEKAEGEFDFLIKKEAHLADAHYNLGVIYEKQGDLVKARSEWRAALKNQSNHPGALKKMAEYK